MPIDFSQFVFQPRPLQQWHIGAGLNSIIEGNRERARLAQQESQYARTRGDTQRTNAAGFAQKTANTAYDTVKGRYDKQAKAIAEARAAVQSGHEDAAAALIPTILELGGEARVNPDGTYYFKEGAAPTRGAPDFAGARRDIYGADGPTTSAPFQVPGFGADGKRNPFEPAALAGASAAALPPPTQGQPAAPPPAAGAPPPAADAAGPPPGPARSLPPPGAVWLPPGVNPPQPPENVEAASAPPLAPNTASPEGALPPPANPNQQPASPQQGPEAAGPNPFNPPGLDPYTIDPNAVRQRNRERLNPYLEGIAQSTPERFAGRVRRMNENVANLGYSPEDTIKLTDKAYGELFGLARGELAAEAQEGRLALSAERQQALTDEKHRDRGFRIAKERMNIESVGKTKEKLKTAEGIYDLLDNAVYNPQSAVQIIAQLYRMNQAGVMTDNDFKNQSQGMLSWLGAVKNFTLDKLLKERGGLNPTTVHEMKEFVDIALGSHKKAIQKSMNSVYRAYQEAKDPTEKQAIKETIISVFGDNPDDLPPDLRPYDPTAEESYDPGDEQAVMERMAAEERANGNLGVVDVPADRHPSGPPQLNMPPDRPTPPGAARGSRVPPKPLRKGPPKQDPKTMTKEQLKKAMDEATGYIDPNAP